MSCNLQGEKLNQFFNRIHYVVHLTQFIFGWVAVGNMRVGPIDLPQLAQIFPEITFYLMVRDLGVTIDY